MTKFANCLKNSKVGTFFASKKPLVSSLAAGTVALFASIPTFAVEPTTPLPTIAVTQEMLTPLLEGVIANVGAILPTGLALFATFLGIRLIPGLFSRFVHM